MSENRSLVESIKTHFADKSSMELQSIVQSNDLAQYSPEAMSAARELLQDRADGLAPEPTPRVDPDPQDSPQVNDRLRRSSQWVMLILGGVLGYWLAGTGWIFQVRTEPAEIVKGLKSEISTAKVWILSSEVYRAKGSKSQMNDTAKYYHGILTLVLVVLGIALALTCHAIGWSRLDRPAKAAMPDSVFRRNG